MMAFVTGCLLIDAPAAALNNIGAVEGAMTDNATGVKVIKTRQGAYPYVSAQAFRYWLRQTLENGSWGWKAAPIYREQKIAYTDADPIKWWDDDLFGYMRAPSKKASAAEARKAADVEPVTPVSETVTRVSPFRTSTLVSLAPVGTVTDFGVMARHNGDPVPYEHEFYRATLHGLFSLDLFWSGTFSYARRTGYLNLDDVRIDEAKKMKLTELENEKAYRLSDNDRLARISALLEALAHVQGGAKLAQHYTDVNPDVLVMAVTKGGNNIFGHIFGVDQYHRPIIKLDALAQSLRVNKSELLSNVYIGWVEGFMDEEAARLRAALGTDGMLAEFAGSVR